MSKYQEWLNNNANIMMLLNIGYDELMDMPYLQIIETLKALTAQVRTQQHPGRVYFKHGG